jgi:hypothetical protein
MDFVIENNQHTLAPRIGASGDAQRPNEIHPHVRTQRADRPLGADQNYWMSDVQCEVEKIRGLFERSCSVRNHKALNFRILSRKPVKE